MKLDKPKKMWAICESHEVLATAMDGAPLLYPRRGEASEHARPDETVEPVIVTVTRVPRKGKP